MQIYCKCTYVYFFLIRELQLCDMFIYIYTHTYIYYISYKELNIFLCKLLHGCTYRNNKKKKDQL